jgi:hypothetical protein
MAQNQIRFQQLLGSLYEIYDCVFIVDGENDLETIKFTSEIEWKLSSFHIQHVGRRYFSFKMEYFEYYEME